MKVEKKLKLKRKKEPVSILDGKRAYGISLQLGSMRGMTYSDIKQAILTMNEEKN